jgi:putative addiction module component (TIGR02574 family)
MELSPAERLEIMEELWDSLSPEELPPLAPEQVKEIKQEWAEHLKNPGSAEAWEDVRRQLRSRTK